LQIQRLESLIIWGFAIFTTMQEIINQIKEIAGVSEIFKAGEQTLVITINLPNENTN